MNKKELTPQEFNNLYRDAITLYADSVWQLADLLLIGKNKFSRKQMLEMINLPPGKVDWLVTIAALTYRDNKQLPEVHFEAASSKDVKKWLKIAAQENLSPVALRKRIRKATGTLKTTKPIKTAQWSRNLMLVEQELKQGTNASPETIKKQLQGLVDLYSRLS